MRQPLYIHSATAISPQHTFDPDNFLRPLVSSDTGKLYSLEAPYARYISPVAIRRMSRIMKLTISTAMQCLKDAGVATPDAIITGTGRGAVTDMEQFLKDMIRLNEEALNPTMFIQSTYNSPNGWIAMQSNCTSYNQTYVHRGCSFELALQDAQMMMAEADRPLRVLAGCFDEMTEEYYLIRGKRGYWKPGQINSACLFNSSDTAGTIGGEGSAFFVLSNEVGISSAVITDLSIVYDANSENLKECVERILDRNGLQPSDISLVISGLNGDSRQSLLYSSVLKLFPRTIPIARFKHLCGEYDTATGFGLWLAVWILSRGQVPVETLIDQESCDHLQNILLINHYILGTASVALIRKANASKV